MIVFCHDEQGSGKVRSLSVPEGAKWVSKADDIK